jgi:hypothetical protein
VSAYEVCCAVCALLSQLTWQHLGFNFAARLTHQLALWCPRWLSFAFGVCWQGSVGTGSAQDDVRKLSKSWLAYAHEECARKPLSWLPSEFGAKFHSTP